MLQIIGCMGITIVNDVIYCTGYYLNAAQRVPINDAATSPTAGSATGSMFGGLLKPTDMI